MKNLRIYGKAPFSIAVIHGGPGACGEMAPVANELASGYGVLEPLQTALSLQGQVEELRTVLENNGNLPVTLIGFSWGAWLSFIVAARYPAIIKKLILVGSGPYEHKYLERINETRFSRLSKEEKVQFESAINILNNPAAEGKAKAFARLGALASKTDAYDMIIDETDESESVNNQSNDFHGVLKEAIEMRRNGKLLALSSKIQCPVVAIHGDYDPHPAEGVQKPLSAIIENFGLILLKNCGHKPWIERQARDMFFQTLKEQLHSS